MQDIKNGDRIAVRVAFNRIQRFRVKEVKDVKAGTLYVTATMQSMALVTL